MTKQKPVAIEAEAAASIELPKSKVGATYKKRYAEREAAMIRRPKDLPRKALARCNGDWLAIELARRTLDAKAKTIPGAFDAILVANGIDPAKWADRNPGMRRMSGGLALRAVVAETETLELPSEEALRPPRSWLQKHQH